MILFGGKSRKQLNQLDNGRMSGHILARIGLRACPSPRRSKCGLAERASDPAQPLHLHLAGCPLLVVETVEEGDDQGSSCKCSGFM
jgi:hypothetical protein